ncbi:MAG: hypothetical protein OXO49_08125 [Gammaproteobacteria bacterium]|nr:hypothetical protein [Gammaproteobacteria bacterium]MDE0251561.1 hypothetical protein [Gammaproteobacteria bacterium]MDE0403429.1 hypothetical protein [Gammaproteobacteria bacterium]
MTIRVKQFQQSKYQRDDRNHRFDQELIKNTGIEIFSKTLFESLLSTEETKNPPIGLKNLRLLAYDELGEERATVAGVLLCTDSPHRWLPHARIEATYYRGKDRDSAQLDSQTIVGPLYLQIIGAVKFIIRNMQVAARKTPARVDMPQYSSKAVFEAVVNAVVHRDYSIANAPIGISMFKDKLEIESPGSLPKGLTTEQIESSSSWRNEIIANLFRRIPVGELAGSSHRTYLMEHRECGVSIIKKETQETCGYLPNYDVEGGSKIVLTIPAAKLTLSPLTSIVTIRCRGEPLSGVEVLVLFPNKTWQKTESDEAGEAIFDFYTSHLPLTVCAAAHRYSADSHHDWLPNQGDLLLELQELEDGGSAIFTTCRCTIPGLNGVINPKRDKFDRLFLFADNMTIDEGKNQPVSFQLGTPIKLTDSIGNTLAVAIIEFTGGATLLEYRRLEL